MTQQLGIVRSCSNYRSRTVAQCDEIVVPRYTFSFLKESTHDSSSSTSDPVVYFLLYAGGKISSSAKVRGVSHCVMTFERFLLSWLISLQGGSKPGDLQTMISKMMKTANQHEQRVRYISSREEGIARCLSSLIHALNCREGATCTAAGCLKMKRVVEHTRTCQRKTSNIRGCSICTQLMSLCFYHSKLCRQSVCHVPFCRIMKRKLQVVLEHQAQQQSIQRWVSLVQSLNYCWRFSVLVWSPFLNSWFRLSLPRQRRLWFLVAKARLRRWNPHQRDWDWATSRRRRITKLNNIRLRLITSLTPWSTISLEMHNHREHPKSYRKQSTRNISNQLKHLRKIFWRKEILIECSIKEIV